uniref:Netrin module non-TIMP type domain-containing protein n=1 Tax=Cyprinus carpio TaxID=7962 RepID=A0A8C1J8X0_CYPCA
MGKLRHPAVKNFLYNMSFDQSEIILHYFRVSSVKIHYVLLFRDATRQMILRSSCDEMELKNEAHYLIMGKDDAVSVLNNEGQQLIPEEKKCEATINRSACHLLNEFIKQHPIKRCDI